MWRTVQIARDTYNTHIDTAGPVAVGPGARSASSGSSLAEIAGLLQAVREAGRELDADARALLETALVDLTAAVREAEPDASDVVEKAGRLRRLVETMGGTALSTATAAATSAIAESLIGGGIG